LTRLGSLTKRTLDVAVSAAALIILCPALAGIACAVRASMGSPVLFRQRRPGRFGVPFELVKFRTMRPPRAGEDAVASDATRLTSVGSFLRQNSLDELPTLWNVLTGDMSLVGPRPLLTQYLDRYTTEQARRHLVKPGVTGWALVKSRYGASAEDSAEKLQFDLYYVKHLSVFLDLVILFHTAKVVLFGRGAR
jgi:sugar transferase EpsL